MANNPWQEENTEANSASAPLLLYPELDAHEQPSLSSSSSSHTQLPAPPQQYQQQQQQQQQYLAHTSSTTASKAKKNDSHPVEEDAPPSYEAVITKDVTQLHDNYDHLRGPPGQRGRDDKIRIPFDTHDSNNSAAAGSSSNGAGSSSHYGSTGILHSPTAPPELGLTGQIALPADEDDEAFTRDIDRLLGADTDADNAAGSSVHSDDDDHSSSCWNIVGEGQAWAATAYMILVILPWSLFCFGWTLAWMIVAGVTMIIPPLGYFFIIFSVTSWRALARVDLVMSEAFVSNEVRQRYPYFTSSVYIEAEPGPAWSAPRLFGRELPLPEFIRSRLQDRHARRGRRPRNLWHRGVRHLKATVNNRHSIRAMFYFLTWKLMFALPVFIVVVCLFSFSLPFMFCFLPSLLAVSRTFANWQYRWSVTWLSEKPAPIVVP
ncbi:hypothetical protein BGZ83_012030 [Gryganskiella cystojenkinii]|nr:hypothetical protein BGZ83_012030 [Gryganskiella cystojenkinii]